MSVEVGFTGSQHGMSVSQHGRLLSTLTNLAPRALHHGDCIGADAQAHALARKLGIRIVLHPPTNPSKRAFCEADAYWGEADYLVRNRQIVDACDVLIAAP